MPRVLITDNLSPAGIQFLQAAGLEVDVRSGLKPPQVREALKEADGIIIRSGTTLTSELLKDQPRVRVIVRAGVGVDNIDLAAATREGIVVMNTPAGNTTSTAEHTIAMLMALSRNIGPAAASMKAGKWDRKSFTGTQLAGKTLAVVGLGRIGLSVAKRAIGLEMKVVGYDPFLSAEKAAEHGIEVVRNVDDLIGRCDFLTVHTPLTDETKGLINAERMAKMRKGARIVNCARGGIVDEEQLADAIESGQIGGAALDVFVDEPPGDDNRLIKLPQVLTTPHLGASTDEAQELVALEAAEIISGFLLRNEVRHAVNMAPLSAAEMADIRASLDLSRRLGLLLAQQNRCSGVRSAHLVYRGEAATKNTRLITASFAAGLLECAMSEHVNIVNAEMLARERGIKITESSSTEVSDFSTMIRATIETDGGDLTAAGTIFGKQFLRLVRLGPYSLDAYLDGQLLIYRHRDVPGLIGFIGTVLGKHNVNIAHMALGRERHEPGGDAVAVLNLDSEPSAEALAEIRGHAEVIGVELVKLPPAGEPLPWLVGN
ncbi:MAG: phosphoglycerate dehydrogenase [Planctomycetaceae bacterium]|nr:phosphoglycerate dehydrogenase [Planctomycetaceae bacterium]